MSVILLSHTLIISKDWQQNEYQKFNKYEHIIKKDPHLILKLIKPNVTPFHMPLV